VPPAGLAANPAAYEPVLATSLNNSVGPLGEARRGEVRAEAMDAESRITRRRIGGSSSKSA